MKWWHAVLLVLALMVASFIVGSHRGYRKAVTDVEVKTDTLYLRDTITKIKPIPHVVYKTDTMLVYVQVRDTIREVVTLPKKIKVYEDSTYRAVVSGFRPSLDEISVFPITKVVTDTRVQMVPKKTRWGIGLQASYGVTLVNGQVIARPYVGVGISWNFITW